MLSSLTTVVKYLLIINIAMFFGTKILMGDYDRLILAVYYPSSVNFQPFQLITHMFMHGTPAHLFFNMYALYIFGVPLENRLGSKRFLNFYLLSGLGALLLYMFIMFIQMNFMGMQLNINIPMLGASGAVFGLLAGFGTLYGEQTLQLLIPPIAMKAKYFVLIYGAIELFLGFSGWDTGVAHFAHVGGAITGYLLLHLWNYVGKKR